MSEQQGAWPPRWVRPPVKTHSCVVYMITKSEMAVMIQFVLERHPFSKAKSKESTAARPFRPCLTSKEMFIMHVHTDSTCIYTYMCKNVISTSWKMLGSQAQASKGTKRR